MAYEKHNFESGEKLYAEQLNEMDAQIALNEEAAKEAANKPVSWDEVTDKPFGKEVTSTMSLFAQGVSFEGMQYAITEPFDGPLILGGIYSIRVKPYNSSTGTNYNGLTAVQRTYNEKDYIMVGDLTCVPGLSDTKDFAPVAFVIDPDNKPDENGVYGWIFTNNETYNSYPPTVWLYGMCEIINPLPKKYLPDDIPTSGGGGGYVIYLDSSMISDSDDTSVTFTYTDSYDEVAEVAHKGGVVWLDGTNVAEMTGGMYARVTVQAVMFANDPNTFMLQTVFNGINAMVMCPNGTWTPPTA